MLLERMRRPLRMRWVDRANHSVADLTGGGSRTMIQVSIQHQPAANPAAEVQVEQALNVTPNAEGCLGQRDQVGVVVEQGHGAERLLDPLLERELLPAGHAVRKVNDSLAGVDRPSKTYADT